MKTLFSLLMISGICFGQGTYVKLSESVSNLKNRIDTDDLPKHKEWVLGNLSEYRIIEDKTLGGFKKEIEDKFILSSRYEDSSLILENKLDTARLIREHYGPVRTDITLNSMLSFCKYSTKYQFKFLEDEIEYDNYEAYYKNGNLFKMNIRFRRLFHGGVVRKNLSYIEVMYNLNGEVEKVKVKWPKFKKIEESNQLLTTDEIFNEYKKEASLHSEVYNENKDTVSVDSVNTVGAAFAWCQVENKISPCMSFLQTVHFRNEKIHTFVDVPYFRKFLK